jgi:hypothetical protein
MNEGFVELVKQYGQNKTELLKEKTVPMPLFTPQMPNGLAWD